METLVSLESQWSMQLKQQFVRCFFPEFIKDVRLARLALVLDHSTVTDLAKFLGWSTSVPR